LPPTATQALRCLPTPSPAERGIWGAIPYQENDASSTPSVSLLHALPEGLGELELPHPT